MIWKIIRFDTKHIISVSHDKTVKIWRISDGACVNTLRERNEFIYAV